MKQLHIQQPAAGLELIPFEDSYLDTIDEWERTGELSKYQSHTRPGYLRMPCTDAQSCSLFYLIRFNARFIGAVWLEEITTDDAKLGLYITDEACRGQGIGTSVITALTQAVFNNLGLKRISLNVRETNIHAISCYEKCGFSITEEYPKKQFSDGSYQGSY